MFSQDKGHKAEFRYFVERIRDDGDPLIPFAEIENVTLASFAAMESARTGKTIKIEC